MKEEVDSLRTEYIHNTFNSPASGRLAGRFGRMKY